MTPEEEQKLRNFSLLGGGSSMEPSQQQQDIAPASSPKQGPVLMPEEYSYVPQFLRSYEQLTRPRRAAEAYLNLPDGPTDPFNPPRPDEGAIWETINKDRVPPSQFDWDSVNSYERQKGDWRTEGDSRDETIARFANWSMGRPSYADANTTRKYAAGTLSSPQPTFSQMFGISQSLEDAASRLGVSLEETPTPELPLLGQAGGQGFAVSPSILGQIPGIENITLGQAPIVSQEGIQYQTPDVFSNIGLGSARGVTQRDAPRPEQIIPAGRFGGQSEARITDLSRSKVQGRGSIAPSGYGAQTVPGATVPAQTDQLLGQVAPTIQSIAEVEQAQEQAPQPEATFLSADGTIKKIYPGESISSKFPNTPDTPLIGTPIVEGQSTFQGTNLPDGIGFQRAPEGMVKAIGPDGKMVFSTPEDANKLNAAYAAENTANTRAQQEFLASPAAREMSNRMLQSVMNDSYAQASAEREARLAAKPDFMRAVSDRERRGTGEMSMASATKLTGGDRDKARAMIELQRQGRDPMTGKEVKAPFEPKEIEIGGKKYIQLTPDYIQPVEEPRAPKKSEIESIREEGVKAGLPENLIRQSIASKLGLDIYDEGVANWIAGNTDTVPSVGGELDVLMIGTDGKIRKVPVKDKEAALKAGYTLK